MRLIVTLAFGAGSWSWRPWWDDLSWVLSAGWLFVTLEFIPPEWAVRAYLAVRRRLRDGA